MKKILVITGPTATGKTALGVALAKKLGGEVVSADSMQLYRGMDIGTAKPTPEEMDGVAHHMLDVAEPWEEFSAARYAQMAGDCVEDILARGRLPIVVGGTGLYIDALVKGLPFAGTQSDGALRRELEAEYEEKGGTAMLEALRAVDPERAEKLHPKDQKRILRALEVYRLTGQTISAHDAASKALPSRYDALKLALTFRDRADLYARIDRRVDEMLNRGLLEEVRALVEAGAPEHGTAMQAIGYKELLPVVRGETDLDAAVQAVKQASRRYAKRQLTWLRRDAELKWIFWKKVPDISLGTQLSTAFSEEYGIL